MLLRIKRPGLASKFLIQNILVSAVLGILIWNVLNQIFSHELKKILDSLSEEKINMIQELGKQYLNSVDQYQHFQKTSIEKILLNTADDFYLVVQHYYEEVKKKRMSEKKAQETLKEILLQKKIGRTGYAYILDSSGRLIFHPEKDLEGTLQNLPGKKYDFIRFQIDHAVSDGQTAFTEYEWKNPRDEKWRPKVMAQVYFKPWNWIISFSTYQVEFDFILDISYQKTLFENLKKQILNLKLGENGYPIIIANEDLTLRDVEGNVIQVLKKGQVIMHPDPQMEGVPVSELSRYVSEQNEDFQSLIQKPKGFWEYDFKGNRKFAAFRKFADLNWTILVTGQKNEFFSENRKIFLDLALKVILVFLLLNILFNFLFFYFGIFRVLKKVRVKLNQVASGNLTVPRVAPKNEDQIGMMLIAINNMINNLENIVSSILGATSDMSKSIEEVSSGNQELSERTEKQAVALEELGSSIEEFTSIVKSNADNTAKSSKFSQEAKLSAEKGGEVVYEAMDTMRQVQDSSYEIENIINMIEEIAFQTNLLALNASVEAARAGEHGRGFAVVALEIRNLAKNTSVFAKKVYDLIKKTVVQIEKGNDLVNRSGESLQEIIDLITDAHTLIAEVSAGSLEQERGIEEINRAIVQLQEINDHNAQMAEETSANSKDMVTKMLMLRSIVKFFNVKKEILEKTKVERRQLRRKEDKETEKKKQDLLLYGESGSKITRVIDTEENLKPESGGFEEF